MKESSIEKRLVICRKCPIYDNGKCSSNLWINPKTDESSNHAKIGFVRGCGCILSVKTKNLNNHCIAGKW